MTRTIISNFINLTSSHHHCHHHHLLRRRHHPPYTLSLTKIRPHTSTHVSKTHNPIMSNLKVNDSISSSVEIIGGEATDIFQPVLKTLKQHPYKPFPLIGWNCHVETISAAFFRSLPGVRFRRECLRTNDNGAVALDWVSGDHHEFPPHSPILILLPGLSGGSDDTYVQHMLVRARRIRWRVVVFNSRGCGGSPVTTPQLYSASFTEDMREVVKHVKTRYPNANLYAIGWSLGANILVRYIGEESHNCLLAGAVSLCNPFNLVVADEDFSKGFNKIYDKALSRALTKIFKKHAPLFEEIGGEYDIKMAANARTVKEFDQGLTRVSFGFKSADDYYSKSSSSDSIKNVRKPLLCIQAANDPIAPSRGIPRQDIKVHLLLFNFKKIGYQSIQHKLKKCTKTRLVMYVELKHIILLDMIFIRQAETIQETTEWLVSHLIPVRGIYLADDNSRPLVENPNCLLIVTPKGGHLGWVAGSEAPFGAPWTDPIVMEFLQHLERGKPDLPPSAASPSEGFHKLEV